MSEKTRLFLVAVNLAPIAAVSLFIVGLLSGVLPLGWGWRGAVVFVFVVAAANVSAAWAGEKLRWEKGDWRGEEGILHNTPEQAPSGGPS